ncbi:methyltransferase domain protein [Ceratobasidium sp. AG-Ba]|nr:methyltransferase domain protein [Ceratobasidium sp. AG-Ba]QRW10953.1 methyltransferase domain protein [Ceratobasidium sp. AG-Ba]
MVVFEYRDPDTDSIVYHVEPDPGSQNEVSTIWSETESLDSGITIQSDERSGYFVLHHGRQQPASGNIARTFPSDNIRRQMLRYLVCKHLLGEDYVTPVCEILAPKPGREHRALELGTRTGTWIQAVAAAFPHVQFRSLDIAPVMAHAPRHNVIFEVYDFTEGLLLDDNSQDVIFLNFLAAMIKDIRALLREVHRVLRPGGVIQFVDFGMEIWDPDYPTKKVSRITNPYTFQTIELVREHLAQSGIDPDTCAKMAKWIAPDSEIWRPNTSHYRGFEQIQQVVRLCPLSPHEGFPCTASIDRRTAWLIGHMMEMTVRDTVVMLKDRSITHEAAERLVEDTIAELRQPDKCCALKLYSTFAKKRP